MRQDRKALAMLDIPDLPGQAFRRKFGSLAPATLEGGGNPLEDLAGGIGDIIGDVGDAIGDVADSVGDALASVDDFVNDVIPGGWITVGAAALIAYGIYDPELLAAAEEGTLTSETLANYGYDAVEVANGVSSIAPEIVTTTEAALSSGISPDLIAMANATADPIAALNAAAGWTASDAAYLASIGYTGMVVNPITGVAVDMPTAIADQAAQTQGWTSAAEQTTANNAGFSNAGEYTDATSRGFTNANDWQESIRASFPDQASYEQAMKGGFQNNWELQTATNNGFATRTEWAHAQDFGITNAAEYQTAIANGTIPPANTIATVSPTGSLQYYDPATGTVYNANGTINTAATSGAPTVGPGTEFAGPVETPYRVDVSGAAGTAEAPNYAITESMTPGSQLATQAQIDAGAATWNPTANAWEVAGTVTELAPIVPAEIATGAGGSTYGVGGINYVAPVVADTATLIVADAGLTTAQIAALGGTAAAAAAVTSMGAGGAAQAANQTIASGAPGSTTPIVEAPVAPVATAPPVVETPITTTTPVVEAPVAPVAPVTTTPPVDYTGPGIGEGVSPVAPTAPPVVTPPTEYTGPGIGETPNPAEVPVTDLSTVAQPMGPSPYDWVAPAVIGAGVGAVAGGALGGGGGATPAGYGPLPPVRFGSMGDLVNPGLNPGFIQARPFYNTTSPVQSQYYWGNHPYAYDQADLANYNTIPYAPVIPWGVQQAQGPLDVNALIRAIVNPQTQAAAAGAAPGTYAPYGTGGSV